MRMLRRKRTPRSTFKCEACGVEHEGPPRAYSLGVEPFGWGVTRDPTSPLWGELGDETAILCSPDGHRDYFIRGNIEIPVADGGDPLTFTAWVTLSASNFERARELWNDDRRVHEPPYFGWLSADVPTYQPVRSMPTRVHTRGPGLRPLIQLDPSEHELAIDQRDGVRAQKLIAIAVQVFHT